MVEVQIKKNSEVEYSVDATIHKLKIQLWTTPCTIITDGEVHDVEHITAAKFIAYIDLGFNKIPVRVVELSLAHLHYYI